MAQRAVLVAVRRMAIGILCGAVSSLSASQLGTVVVRQLLKDTGLDPSIVNVNGGAIAQGHPIGASGVRILVTLLHEMIRRDVLKGLASLCVGGGMGVAMAIERE